MYVTQSALSWWKANVHTLPILAEVAKITLTVQPTSVAAERVFSTAGDIFSEKKFRLGVENIK